jgi:hypothetical protein
VMAAAAQVIAETYRKYPARQLRRTPAAAPV